VSFGQHLRTLRTAAGLPRAEAARRARVPTSTLRGWENDRGFPPLPALLRLADALRVPVERIAEGVDDPAGDEAELGQEEPRRPPKSEPSAHAVKRPQEGG
jgi:transcriptional regulator with XRE-family HTH domain